MLLGLSTAIAASTLSRHAINLAYLEAQRNTLFVDLHDNSLLYHDVHGQHAAAKVALRAAPRGTGLRCSDVVRTVLLGLHREHERI